MTPARILVSESSGCWAFALRSVLVESGVLVTEVAGLAKAFGRFRDDSQALLALEVTEACAEEAIGLMHSSRHQDRGRGVLVLLDGPLALSASLWQEAGAIAVVASSRHLNLTARLIRRYFDKQETPPLTFRETVWQRLPWNKSDLTSDL